MCKLFEIWEQKAFQKCMGWVGGGGAGDHIFEHYSCNVGTQTCTEHFTLAYSESLFASSFSGRAGTPFGQTSPCLLLGTYFFSFCQSCSLRLFTGTHPEFRGLAQRPSVVRSTFCCFVSLTLSHSMDSLYPAFIHTKPGCRAGAESPAPTLHPLSEPFYAPNAFVVLRGKQQPVEKICMQTW